MFSSGIDIFEADPFDLFCGLTCLKVIRVFEGWVCACVEGGRGRGGGEGLFVIASQCTGAE